jgi:hypothetical protein
LDNSASSLFLKRGGIQLLLSDAAAIPDKSR